MTTIQIKDTVAEQLAKLAGSHGLTLEDYLESLALQSSAVERKRLSGAELIRLIEAESDEGNPSYTGTFTREEIYADHD